MVTLAQLCNREEKLCVVGLGYVGLPLAVLLSKHFETIGFDIHREKIEELKTGYDRMNEVSDNELKQSALDYTSDAGRINEAQYIIVAVPTPVDNNNIPDLGIVKKASEMVGKNMAKGSIVVFESTVYPGVTEDICVPILEQASGMKHLQDFWVGYSPERVNPGDKEHTIDKITKVVSGSDEASAQVIAGVYGKITNTYSAASIRVAEAAKVIENTQRDINIALMNELAMLFSKMDISVYDVLEAAGTKWNFLKFRPGLVGGHCIGVDPYYLTFKAQEVGHRPEMILAGRGINDGMHKFIASEIIKEMVSVGKDVSKSKFVVLGLTFKENVKDIRNSKVAELVLELKKFGVEPLVYDPIADPKEVEHEYGIQLAKKEDLPKADTLIVAVAHSEFKDMTPQHLREMMNHENLLLVDVQHLYDKTAIEEAGIRYWSL
ncbi:nucleotide sugar dehydrogenase [Candidatus Nomurabacteria bacterium]|nr:nucleotide sugar dehydrogenase [Candidatus Nomurabacteria bacterium]